MDRQFVYEGQIPLETDLLNTNRNVLEAFGLLIEDLFGSATVVSALPCTPTSPPSLNVNVGAGRIYALENVDNSAYSTLPADTTDQISKQGINFEVTELSCPAPSTVGYTIDYLIEGAYEDVDGGDTVLAYYNATIPASPYSGPGNAGTSQPTVRQGVVELVAKAGIPAPTGTQAIPSADSGFVPLYVVTVAYGQTTILSGNISVAPGAPFIGAGFLTEAIADGRYLRLIGGTLTGSLNGTNATFSTSVTVNGFSVQNATLFTSGLIGAARVPEAAVTQYQADLAIAWGQITGTKNADQLNGFASSSAATDSTIVARTSAGYIYGSYLNQSSENAESLTVSQVICQNATDGFNRKVAIANLFEQMMLSGAVTLEADPGGTPADGTPGSLVLYY